MRIAGFLLVGLALGLPHAASAQQVEGGVFLTYAFLEQIGSNDHRAGTSTMGLGGRIVWHVLPFVDVEGEVAGHPNAGVQGYRIQGFAGAKAGFSLLTTSPPSCSALCCLVPSRCLIGSAQILGTRPRMTSRVWQCRFSLTPA